MESSNTAPLAAAANLAHYYTVLAHALRRVHDAQARAQLTDTAVDEQLTQLRIQLVPVLDRNPVVRDHVDSVALEVARIRKAAAAGERGAAEDARRMAEQVEGRARTVTDLVALFRSL